jgi:hypothetical protein
MELVSKLKNCKTSMKIAIAFAFTILLSSYLMGGHEQANTLLILHVGLYVMVMNFAEGKNTCKTTNCAISDS